MFDNLRAGVGISMRLTIEYMVGKDVVAVAGRSSFQN